MTRVDELYPAIRRMRENDGLMWREIAARLGVSLSTAHQYYTDQDGTAARARKAKNYRHCLDCGKTINTDGRMTNPAERCRGCTGAASRALTRQWILDSFAEWHALFGVAPTTTEWNPALARQSGNRDALARHDSTGRPWPSSSTIIDHFGSFTDALLAAGMRPLTASERSVGRAGCELKWQDEADEAA